PFYGLAVLCIDDEHVRSIVGRVGRPITTYGLAEGADVRATNVRRNGLQTRFDVERSGGQPLPDVVLNLPGTHNVRNALAAIAVASEVGISDDAIRRAL